MEIGVYNADVMMDTGQVTWRRKINRTLGIPINFGRTQRRKIEQFPTRLPKLEGKLKIDFQISFLMSNDGDLKKVNVVIYYTN